MLGELLNTGFGPFKVKIWLAILAAMMLAAGVVVKVIDNRDERLIDTAKDAGSAGAVIEGQKDTLDQVERANNADREIDRGGDAARYERCLRNATAESRANCDRFAPLPD